MKFKSVVLLAVAIGCGLVAMLGVQQVLSDNKDESNKENLAQVLVATTAIFPGAALDDSNSTFKDWPKDALPDGAVTKTEEYEGRAVTAATVPGEVIMLAKLGEPGIISAASEIPKGMRVVTVPVNLTKTHSGLIMPGNRVDVLVTYSLRIPGQGTIKKTKTVLEYIKVFATDNVRKGGVADADSGGVQAKNISLLVDPQQANLLMFAQDKGPLQLALRSNGDTSVGGTVPIDDNDFDQLFSSRGADDKEPATDDKSDEQSDSDGLRDLLGDLLAKEQQAETEDEPVVEESEAPMWTIRIFEGKQLRVEQVELPPEPVESIDSSATLHSEQNDSEQNDTVKSWQGWLQKVLIGAKKGSQKVEVTTD